MTWILATGTSVWTCWLTSITKYSFTSSQLGTKRPGTIWRSSSTRSLTSMGKCCHSTCTSVRRIWTVARERTIHTSRISIKKWSPVKITSHRSFSLCCVSSFWLWSTGRIFQERTRPRVLEQQLCHWIGLVQSRLFAFSSFWFFSCLRECFIEPDTLMKGTILGNTKLKLITERSLEEMDSHRCNREKWGLQGLGISWPSS